MLLVQDYSANYQQNKLMEANMLPELRQIVQKATENEELLGDLLDKMRKAIGAYIRNENASLSKQMAKKTKELFVLSSDNESYREIISEREEQIRKLNQNLSQKQKEIVRILSDAKKEVEELREKFNQKEQSLNKDIQNLQTKIKDIESSNRSYISDLRRSQRQEIAKTIEKEQQSAEENLQRLREELSEEKQQLILTQNKERSDLVKKYEHRLQDLRDEHEDQLYKLNTEHKAIKQKDSSIKTQLQKQLFKSQSEVKRLEAELRTETMGHLKYKQQSQQLKGQLSTLNQSHEEEMGKLNAALEKVMKEGRLLDRKRRTEIDNLKNTLQSTIQQKDLLFEQTVATMKNQHETEVEALKTNMMEERELEFNKIETRHYEETMRMNNEYFDLEKQHIKLKKAYEVVESQYEAKISTVVTDYEEKIESIQLRTDYELKLEGESSRRSSEITERKYKMEIRSLNQRIEDLKEEFGKKIADEKSAITNKLTSHYEIMISDMRVSNEVVMKQKSIQFERKSKGYEKKLNEAEKRRVELKLQTDRQKLDSQLRIDSLVEKNDSQEEEIEELHSQVMRVEKEKSVLANDFQFQMLVMRNEVQQTKDDYQIKQEELRNLLNEKLAIKNLEISKFSKRMKAQVETLLEKHNRRVSFIQKEYSELKKIMGEKTSLPEDIEALKVFYAGYLEIEQKLEKQREAKKKLQMQLLSKVSIEKVFTSKAFIPRVEKSKQMQSQKEKNSNIKISTVKNWRVNQSSKEQRLAKFSSQHL